MDITIRFNPLPDVKRNKKMQQIAKVHEELDELETACVVGREADIAEEYGDLLTAVLNMGAVLGIADLSGELVGFAEAKNRLRGRY